MNGNEKCYDGLHLPTDDVHCVTTYPGDIMLFWGSYLVLFYGMAAVGKAALLAPTAINQQKFSFEYIQPHGDNIHKVKANKGFSMVGYTQMDLGIAKLHFEIGAGKENFEWV